MNESLRSAAAAPDGDKPADPQSAGPAPTLPFQQPIFLVGMMGAGKTTIGRHLARTLGWEFVDLDHELEARCGVRVALIFDIEGEQGFRKRESAVLDECTRRSGIVLATGGGAILSPENRRLLRERGVVVYLRASIDELFRRVERDRNRPLLQTCNPRQRLQDLLEQREPLYHDAASLVFDTGTMPITQTVRSLVRHLQEYNAADPQSGKTKDTNA